MTKLEDIKARLALGLGKALWPDADVAWLVGECERLREGLNDLECDARAHQDVVIEKRIRHLLEGGAP